MGRLPPFAPGMYPILFRIGSFPIHTYGVLMIVAFLAALWIARKRAPRFGISPNKLSDMAFLALIGGVLGARILYLMQDPPKDWHGYLTLQFAGLTSFGGYIGGALVVLWWARKSKTPLRSLLDVLGPPLLVGQAIGRVGCLLNGCCYGHVCDVHFFLGVHIPDNNFLHYPAQLYDTILTMTAFGAVLLTEKRRHLRLGQAFALSLSLLGLGRVIDEFWRAGTDAQVNAGYASSTYWGNLPFTQAQVAAAGMILLGIVLYIVYARRPEPAPPAEPQNALEPPEAITA
ncbi:MAG TPA: prolipoprotein diacylglyceryl transferase [Fimbriimonadaceae bacterium]|nr:prolipoprotein diacylglyceryl transferase [Fimbriimonadaceae bacterium]